MGVRVGGGVRVRAYVCVRVRAFACVYACVCASCTCMSVRKRIWPTFTTRMGTHLVMEAGEVLLGVLVVVVLAEPSSRELLVLFVCAWFGGLGISETFHIYNLRHAWFSFPLCVRECARA